MKLHTLQYNPNMNAFWIPSLQLFWADRFAHLPTYTSKYTCWPKVSKVNREKLEKDEDTQHPKA